MQVNGQGWAEAIHPDDRESALDAWNFALAHGDEYCVDCRVRNGKTGEYRWFHCHALPQREAGGRIVQWFGTCTDIDRRKRAEQEFRLLLDKLPAAAYMCDPDGLITYFNTRAVELWGRSPKLDDHEDRYCGSFKLFAANGMPLRHDQCWMALTLRTNQGHNGREIQVERPNGERLIGLAFANPIQDESGRLVGAVNVVVDITDRKRSEEALRESEDRLQILSRRVVDVQEEERRRLARELHDEIGQVLTAIGMNLQVMRAAGGHAKEQRLEECLAIVNRAFLQVRNLALDLRPPMLDDLGLAAALRWLVDRQAQRDGLIAHIIVDSGEAELPFVLATACYRIVQEAMTNIARHAGAKQVWVELHQDDDEVELIVRDDGIGFAPEKSTRPAPLGTGLGLLGMQERVRLLGGRIDIKSTPGQGTAIRAYFPLTPSPSSGDPDRGVERT